MGKMEVIAEQKAALIAANDAALESTLGNVWDTAWASKPTADGGFTQEQMDAAIADALAADQVQDEALLNEIKTKAEADLAALQAKFDELAAKEAGEAQVIAQLQASLDELQASVAAVLAFLKK